MSASRSPVPTARDHRPVVKVFAASRGNAFMREIAEWLVEAAAAAGRTSLLVVDDLPRLDGAINLVVAPHEFFALSEAPARELQRAAAASICVCTEQPGTPWFHLSVDACRRGPYALDISGAGVEALRAVGVRAGRLHLGAVASMSATPPRTRSVDVLFLGSLDGRRAEVLADLAPVLHRRHAEIRVVGFERPARPGDPGVVLGRRKHELLASSQVVLNIHRDRAGHAAGAPSPPYFEWARVVEALANGCVVVTEPSADHEPLVPGRDFVAAGAAELGTTIRDLLDDPGRLRTIAAAGRRAVSDELRLESTLADVIDDIECDVMPELTAHASSTNPHRGLWRLGASKAEPRRGLTSFEPYAPLRATAKRLALAENRALQRLDAARCVLRHGSPSHVEEVVTAAYIDAVPEVSVIVTVYNYGDVVAETLDSILDSEHVASEVIVVDDHSTDHSRAVLTRYLDAHQDVPMRALLRNSNGGLAAARNMAFAAARAELVMVMDADNLVYPRCLRVLADALQADPFATAAYSILAEFGEQCGLRSAYAWDPERLCRANYIDAQAMFRRELWEAAGGYRSDDETFGWEDWDLWLRVAARGGYALQIPQMLGRYRVQKSSMIALTNLATRDSLAALRVRYADLPWPDDPTRA